VHTLFSSKKETGPTFTLYCGRAHKPSPCLPMPPHTNTRTMPYTGKPTRTKGKPARSHECRPVSDLPQPPRTSSMATPHLLAALLLPPPRRHRCHTTKHGCTLMDNLNCGAVTTSPCMTQGATRASSSFLDPQRSMRTIHISIYAFLEGVQTMHNRLLSTFSQVLLVQSDIALEDSRLASALKAIGTP